MLVFAPDGVNSSPFDIYLNITTACFRDGGWYHHDSDGVGHYISGATHWMPLPKDPKTE